MAKGKLILICHSGGEFVTNDDGTMSYKGGEASAANITSETPFNDVKLMLAEVCNLDQKRVSIKYFLPGNKKNLIVVKNDKDVKRLIDFHGDAFTADVFVMGTTGFDRSALDMESNRAIFAKKGETSNNNNAFHKKDKAAKQGNTSSKKNKTRKHGKVSTKKDNELPGRRTRSATAAAAANTKVSSDDNLEGSTDVSDGDKSEGRGNETSSSTSESDNEKACLDSGSDSSDYVPTRSAYRRKSKNQGEVGVDASPADSVKRRRRTPSWKFGANGRPTIVSSPDNVLSKYQGKSGKAVAEDFGGGKSQRKSSRLAAKGYDSTGTKSGIKRARRVADDSDQEFDILTQQESDSEENLPLACDDYAFPDPTVDAWKSAITGVGQEFDNVNEFRAALKKYAIANRFGYRFKKNDTSRATGGCAAEGCTWRFYASWVPTTQSFVIKTMNNVHTCNKESRKSAHPAKNWLIGTIKDRLRASPYLRPKEIANGLLQDFGVELNYTQVWRGIGDAREQLHGSLKESYNKLPWFCEKLVKTNPGSIANLVIGDKKRFKSLFVSFYALVHGFQSGCRPLIFLESASMKSRYGEILLTASAIDGNDCFIPVAFAVVDVEDDDNWYWFLEQLKTSIFNARPITFVVDRDKDLKKSVLAVFEDAHVGYSMYHLLASFKRNMKGPFHGDGKGFLPVHFLAAAHSVRLIGFKKSIEKIKSISSQAYDWVMQIEPEHWASSYFKGERYNFITEDVGESYAKLMDDYRHLPILQKIDALIRSITDDMVDAKLEASMWSTQLTAAKERELEEEKLKAHGLKVLISSDILFEVREDSTHVVNISDQSCTCMQWKERGLPCRHALAVFSLTGKSPYDYCSHYFTADAYRLTYQESICPIPIDGPHMLKTLRLENEEAEKQGKKAEGEKEDGGKGDYDMEDGNMETGEKTDKEEGSREDNEIEETNNVEGEKMEVDVGNVDGENEDGTKLDAEKDEVGNADGKKEEGGNLDTENEEGSKMDTEKEEGRNLETEKEEGGNLDTEKEEGSNLNKEKEEVSNLDTEKEEGGILDTEKEEGGNLDEEKEEGGNLDKDKEEGSNLDAKKEEGSKMDVEKDEGNMFRFREEHEDPNVLVLPPLPAKSSSCVVKKEKEKEKEAEGVETEGEMRRKVKCSQCKQTGHYKKSCKTKL